MRSRLDRVANALRAIPDDASEDVTTRKARAVQLTTSLMVDVVGATEVPPTSVAWVEGPSANPASAPPRWTWPSCCETSSGAPVLPC